jgi:MFS family permease
VPPDRYRPVKDDEYIDNWTTPQKLNLICEPGYKIGLLGSATFAGIVTTVLIVPPLADKVFGRRPIVNWSNLVNFVALLGLFLCNNIYQAYFFLFLAGTCFAGRVIVLLNYVLEFCNAAF